MADGLAGQVSSLISLLGGHIALPTRCVCYCTSPTCAGGQPRPAPPAPPPVYGPEPPAAA